MEYGWISWNTIALIYSVICLVKSQFPSDMFQAEMMGMDEDSPVLDNTTPEAVNYTEGQIAVLPCRVQNAGDVEVSWLNSNYEIISISDRLNTDDKRISVDTSNPGEWNLVIKDVRRTDSGQYTCMLQTFPPQTKLVTLFVYVPPTIDKDSLLERYLFQSGQRLVVVCEVEGDPEPFVQWYAYRTISSSMKEVKDLVSSSSILEFEKLQPSDGGIYRCEASNTVGNDMYEIFLQEVYEPRLNTTMQTIGVKEFAPTVLQCEIESNPQANVAWQRDGKLIRTNWKYSIAMFAESDTKIVTELTIKHTVQTDGGEYLCVASNSYGNNNIRYYVIVEVSTTTTATTTTSTTTTPEMPSTTKRMTPPPRLTEPPPDLLAHSTTYSQVETNPDEPKTGASLNKGNLNTQSVTVFLSTCTILLLHVL